MTAFDWATSKAELERVFGVDLALPAGVATTFDDWQELSRLVAAVAHARGAKVIAVSGSQGSGKTTFSQILTQTCNVLGLNGHCCSIDDFYLSHADRRQLALDVHPLLQTRGVPGTHEWRWLQDTLSATQSGTSDLSLPVFDKGLDDRAGTVSVQADTLVLEGWCVGVMPQPEPMLIEPCNELERSEDPQGVWRRYVNEQVREHYQPLWSLVDLWVHLRVPGFDQVVAWRTQQEQQLPPDRRMSEQGITRFIAHYERITRWLWKSVPLGPGVVVGLDEHHSVVTITASAGDLIQG